MNSKRIGYCFPNLLEAFFIVIALYFLELLTNSLIWHLGIRSGLKPVAIEDLGGACLPTGWVSPCCLSATR